MFKVVTSVQIELGECDRAFSLVMLVMLVMAVCRQIGARGAVHTGSGGIVTLIGLALARFGF